MASVTEKTSNLNSSEERDLLPQMVEQAPSIIALVREPNHRIVLANKAFREIFGEEIVNRTAQEVLPPQIARTAVEKLDQVYRSATPLVFSAVEVPVPRSDQTGTDVRVLELRL